jgi:hypothetical protein
MMNIAQQLEKMALLKDGWLDGKGLAPKAESLKWLTLEFDSNYEIALPLPYLYSTAKGGVQAEWSGNNWEISLEIDLNTKKAEFQAVNIQSKEALEKDIDLDTISGWTELNQTLLKLLSPIE